MNGVDEELEPPPPRVVSDSSPQTHSLLSLCRVSPIPIRDPGMIVMQPLAALMKLQFLRGQPLVLGQLDQVRCRGLDHGQIMKPAPILVHLDGITSNGVSSTLSLAPILPIYCMWSVETARPMKIKHCHYRREAKFGFGCESPARTVLVGFVTAKSQGVAVLTSSGSVGNQQRHDESHCSRTAFS